MQGRHVLHPMGFDAFGLPAEQYAVETGVHPRLTTERNVGNFTRQLRAFGLSYDWDRVLATTDPGYYRWTQWIFLRLFHSWFDPEQGRARPIAELVGELERGERLAGDRPWGELIPAERQTYLNSRRLAYIDEVPVNWCPGLGTVLANEEVTREGRSERGDFPVYRRPLRQWMLRITAYAERLLADLELVDSTYAEPETELVGTGGEEVWTFRAVGAGTADLELSYERSSGESAGEPFALTVVVSA